LHEGVVLHQRFGARDLFHEELVEARSVVLAKQVVSIALNLIVGIMEILRQASTANWHGWRL